MAHYITDEFSSIAAQSALPGKGEVWVVENTELLSNTALFRVKSIYIRQETVRLWNKLQTLQKENRMVIQGSPGIGKSTEVFGCGDNDYLR
jgi:hypothetical protein